MGFFRKNKDEEDVMDEAIPPCPHVALSARWDDPNDMGKEELASAYVCQSCSEVFTPAEVQRLRATESERVHAVL
jgi:hypothetical protein